MTFKYFFLLNTEYAYSSCTCRPSQAFAETDVPGNISAYRHQCYTYLIYGALVSKLVLKSTSQNVAVIYIVLHFSKVENSPQKQPAI